MPTLDPGARDVVSGGSRRRIAALLACACSTLVAQPALAAKPADKPDHGKETAPGQVAGAPAGPAVAAAPAAPVAANPAPPARAKGGSRSTSARGGGGGAAKARPDASPRSSSPAPGRSGGKATSSKHAGGRPGTAPPTASGHKAAGPTSAKGKPARNSAAAATTSPARGNSETARSKSARGSSGTATSKPTRGKSGTAKSKPARGKSGTTASKPTRGKSGTATHKPDRNGAAATSQAPGSAAQVTPATATPDSSAIAATAATLDGASPTAAATTTTRPPSAGGERTPDGGAATASRGESLIALRDRLLGVAAPAPGDVAQAGRAPTTTLAALGVRELDGVETGPGVRKPARDEGASFATVLHDVAEVIPAWVWIALGVLSALILALGANTILAAARTRRLERQRAKLLEDVGTLQAALLPVVPSRLGELATTVAYRPADGLAAGGDFYDVFALPDGRVGLLLGDVSGHGRDAIAKTALVRFTVRAHLEAGMSPREAISIAGRSLDGRLGGDFATVIAAIHDPARGTLTYSSAGHPPPLVVGPSAHVPLTASSAPPIDLGFPTGQRQTVLPLPDGSIVALYSDGLTEARVDGELIGGERLATWLADLGPDATAQQLVDLVVRRADRVRDDLAVVVLHASAGATAPPFRVEQLKLDLLDTAGPDVDVFLRAAGIGRAERRRAGRRAAEQLAAAGGVLVEVLASQPPRAGVSPIGGVGADAPRQRAPAH